MCTLSRRAWIANEINPFGGAVNNKAAKEIHSESLTDGNTECLVVSQKTFQLAPNVIIHIFTRQTIDTVWGTCTVFTMLIRMWQMPDAELLTFEISHQLPAY